LRGLAETFDLPADTVVKSYEIDHALRTEQQRILADASTPWDQKLQMISKIRQETDSAMKNVLGEQAFKLYQPPPTPMLQVAH